MSVVVALRCWAVVIMKVVPPLAAYFCIVTSAFGVVILAVLGLGFSQDWEPLMGQTSDPEDKDAVARTLFITAGVFAAFLAFCGCQVFVERRIRL